MPIHIAPRNRKVRILATLGPASGSPYMIRELFISGADAKYDSIGSANGITLDNKFQRAPGLSYGAGASYSFSLGSAGSLTAMAHYSWPDEQASTPTDSSNPPLSRRDALVLPSYNVTNIRLEYRDAQNHWAVSAFVTNLFDKLYYIGGVDYPETSPHFDIGRPREIGVTARYKF